LYEVLTDRKALPEKSFDRYGPDSRDYSCKKEHGKSNGHLERRHGVPCRHKISQSFYKSTNHGFTIRDLSKPETVLMLREPKSERYCQNYQGAARKRENLEFSVAGNEYIRGGFYGSASFSNLISVNLFSPGRWNLSIANRHPSVSFSNWTCQF
jgi:hypothetical protein